MTFDWANILGTVFEYIVFPAISAAAVYFITWIRAKKQELIQKTKDETTKKYLEMLDKTITDCTLATSQTYVDALKAAGSFDADAQKHAFQLTFDAVMAVLTDEAQKYLAEAVKDIPAYITTKIEANIKSSKA
jgi:hypothetical protein